MEGKSKEKEKICIASKNSQEKSILVLKEQFSICNSFGV